MDLSVYQAKVYPWPPCWCLVSDVYVSERGERVDEYTASRSVRDIASAFRTALHRNQHGFVRIEQPVDFAIVLMGHSQELGMHHAGIYYEGRVLHAEETCTFYQDLASLRDKYAVMEFWARP